MKKYLSALLGISLLLMATGCNQEEKPVETEPTVEVEDNVALDADIAMYRDAVNVQHNAVIARNLFNKMLTQYDSEVVEKRLSETTSEDSVKYGLRIKLDSKYTYTAFDAYYGRYVNYPKTMKIDFPSQITFENNLLIGLPTLLEYGGNNKVIEAYITYDQEVIHLSYDAEKNCYFDADKKIEVKAVLQDGLIHHVKFNDVTYDIHYDELKRIADVDLINAEGTRKYSEYTYNTDAFQKFPDTVKVYLTDEETYTKTYQDGVVTKMTAITKNATGNLVTREINFDEQGHISDYYVNLEDNRYHIVNTYDENGLIIEDVIYDQDEKPLEKATYEYLAEDNGTLLKVMIATYVDEAFVEACSYEENYDENFFNVSSTNACNDELIHQMIIK